MLGQSRAQLCLSPGRAPFAPTLLLGRFSRGFHSGIKPFRYKTRGQGSWQLPLPHAPAGGCHAPLSSPLRWEDPGSPEGTGSSFPGPQISPRGGVRRRGLQNSGPGTPARGTAAPPGTDSPVTAGHWTLDTGPARAPVTRGTGQHVPLEDPSSGHSDSFPSSC